LPNLSIKGFYWSNPTLPPLHFFNIRRLSLTEREPSCAAFALISNTFSNSLSVYYVIYFVYMNNLFASEPFLSFFLLVLPHANFSDRASISYLLMLL
jgi:hypothetical protein